MKKLLNALPTGIISAKLINENPINNINPAITPEKTILVGLSIFPLNPQLYAIIFLLKRISYY
jgi:hypothetical protein